MADPLFPSDLLDAFLALRLQYVSAVTLANAIRRARRASATDPRPVLSYLAEEESLSSAQDRALATARQQCLHQFAGDPERCLRALGIAEAERRTLLHGSESDIAALLTSIRGAWEQLVAQGEWKTGAAPSQFPAEDQGLPTTPLPVLAPQEPLPEGSTQPGNATPTHGEQAVPPALNRPGATESPSRFRKLRLHAKGGLGSVSIATDEQIRRKVAIKEILDQHADSPESRARFLREAEITGALEHPGIVPVYALGQHLDGRPFYVMRFVRGVSLQTAIDRLYRGRTPLGSEFDTPDTLPAAAAKKSGPTPDAAHRPRRGRLKSRASRRHELRRLLRRFLTVCETIHYAHSRGVIHRDLKPSNIMLGKYGETLVVDWGLAKTLNNSLPADDSSSNNGLAPGVGPETPVPTLSGRVIGTPGFMSPEQALGEVENLGPASDVFSLGATLYCLLTGQPPFSGSPYADPVEQIRQREFPRPSEREPDTPRALEAICLKAMAWKPEDRYASAAALAEDLERWLSDEPVSAWSEPWLHRAGRWLRRHRSWTVAGAATLVLITVVSLVAAAWVNSERTLATRAQRNEAVHRQIADFQKQEAQRLAASLLVNDVEALRRDRPIGWTWKGREQLARAAALAPDAADPVQARSLAAACLSSVDARLHSVHATSQISYCVAFSPDSSQLAIAASKAGMIGPARVTLVDLATGKARNLTYSRDHLWELRNGGRTDGGRSLAFSPDGDWLVVGTRSGWLHRWRLSDAEPEAVAWQPAPDQVEVHDVTFSPDGRSLYAATRNARGKSFNETISTITRWETDPWSDQPAASREIRGAAYLAWTLNPRRLFAGGAAAHWLNPATLAIDHKKTAEELGESGAVRRLAGSPAHRIIAGEDSNRVYLMDEDAERATLWLEDPRLKQSHAGDVRGLDISPDGCLLATGANEDGVKVWSLAAGKLGMHLPLPGSETTFPQFSADGRYLASPADRSVVIYEVASRNALDTAALQADPFDVFACCLKGTQLLTAAQPDGATQLVIRLWSNEGTRQTSWTIDARRLADEPPPLAFHPSGYAICAPYGQPAVWLDARARVESGAPVPVENLGPSARMLAFSADGSRLWVAVDEHRIQCWDVLSNHAPPKLRLACEYTTRGLAIVTGHQQIKCLATAGGRGLAGLDNGMVMVMHGTSRDDTAFWTTDGKVVQALAISGDGRLAAAGTDRGTIIVYHAETGRPHSEVGAFSAHGVQSLAFNAAGDLLAAASTSGQVRLWRLQSGAYELQASLREGDGRRVALQFPAAPARLAMLVEGERAVQLWRLDVLQEEFIRLGLP